MWLLFHRSLFRVTCLVKLIFNGGVFLLNKYRGYAISDTEKIENETVIHNCSSKPLLLHEEKPQNKRLK